MVPICIIYFLDGANFQFAIFSFRFFSRVPNKWADGRWQIEPIFCFHVLTYPRVLTHSWRAASRNVSMRHNVQAEGWGIRLRPVRLADAEFIVWLRNLDHARGRVGDSALDTTAQQS